MQRPGVHHRGVPGRLPKRIQPGRRNKPEIPRRDSLWGLHFPAVPDETLISGYQQMMVVEGRRPRCWACKEIGHIAKFCPRKAESTTTIIIIKQAEAQGPGQVQPKTSDYEGWTEVTRKRSPKQGLLRNRPRPHHHQNDQQHRNQ